MNVFQLVIDSSIVAKIDVAFLFFLSVMSWTIIFYKLWVFRKADSENKLFLKYFTQKQNIGDLKSAALKYKQSPLAVTFLDGYERLGIYLNTNVDELDAMIEAGNIEEINVKSLEKSLKFAGRDEIAYLETYLPFLATTSSVAPLLGLFGTVWGIMHSFYEIGLQSTASISAVAPGIAEALVTTAAGLIAAIPAVVAFNFFRNLLKGMSYQINAFINEFVEMVEDLSKKKSNDSNAEKVLS